MIHKGHLIVFCSLLTIIASGAHASQWPTSSWPVDQAFINNHPKEIKELSQYLFDPKVESRQTTGAIIIRKGKIIFEEYGPGHSADRKYIVWSISKSFVNAMIGIAVKDSKVRLSDSICDHGFKTKCAITVENLLRFNSAIDWTEAYENTADLEKSDVINMLYRDSGQKNMAQFTLKHGMAGEPGKIWNYSSGDSNLLMALLKNVYKKNYADLPWKKLFNKIGMKKVTWETDRSGTFVGSSYIFTTLQDLARFAFLYMKDGVWNGERILPEGWVQYSATPPPSMYDRPDFWSRGGVGGAHWWLNKANHKHNIPKPVPEFPENAMASFGHWEQYLFISPSEDLIVIRIGNTRTSIDKATGLKSFDPRTFLQKVKTLVGAP